MELYYVFLRNIATLWIQAYAAAHQTPLQLHYNLTVQILFSFILFRVQSCHLFNAVLIGPP